MVRSFCFVTPYYAIAAIFLPYIVSREDLYFVENKIIYFLYGRLSNICLLVVLLL